MIAKISNFTRYANANLPAKAIMPAVIIDDPAIYPPAEQLENIKIGLIFGPKLERLRTRAWAQIKTGL